VFQQDKKCTYNVILRRVRVTFFWRAEARSVTCSEWHCSFSYPACNAHAPYCHLWPALLYNIFPHYLINGTIFEKKLLNTKCVFWFSLQLLS